MRARRFLILILVSSLALGAACVGRTRSPGSTFASATAGSEGVSGSGAFGASDAGSAEESGRLTFADGRGGEHVFSTGDLRAACEERIVEVDDPYHEARMRYLALPLGCVLDLGFASAGGASGLADEGLLLRALDGYTRPVSGRDLLEAGAFLAFGEPDDRGAVGAFRRIDRRQVDPSPFYLVWTGVAQNDPHEHPWPYQLGRIEVAPFAEAFPRTVPTGLAEADPGWAGFALFQKACASCHSINTEGGKVGPDLNLPMSIVEYRPVPQIRAYIRNPLATRYTSMPPHPNLSEADLDALIAYFEAMRDRKQDPRGEGAAS